jgi:hypothetical protein
LFIPHADSRFVDIIFQSTINHGANEPVATVAQAGSNSAKHMLIWEAAGQPRLTAIASQGMWEVYEAYEKKRIKWIGQKCEK